VFLLEPTKSERHGLDLPSEDRGWYRIATIGDQVRVVFLDGVWARHMTIPEVEAAKLRFKN
jgi:hypothetical protein